MQPSRKSLVAARAINPEFQWALWAFLIGFAVGLGLKFTT